ncbi:2Fe-2S iron-sulfur cluster binding domain-containing protein [Nocardioides sp. WS12]|uniref:2Fe-2S iron-sulfur cluster-binding protein n=1 Tax=Nocardioides sp. WS12 TaxID=2486272 RepID=UPI001F39DF43|nr:2Fe-2S iron-sulfur cluster binding domain-containing protein [Nocardioides sp. WS12]
MNTITFNNGEETVACEPGETILLAGLRNGLRLPYECASGGCGACKVRLVEGRIQSRWPDATGITERDRRRGDRILMCQSTPDSAVDVRVHWQGDPGEDPGNEPAPTRHPAVLTRRDMLTADTALFEFSLDGPMEYLSGQFVQIEFPDDSRRAYSMSRPFRSEAANIVELLVRAKPGGTGSAWLFDKLSIGDDLTVEGPYGRAYVRPDSTRKVVCLAGGTGTAPVLSIATSVVEQRGGEHVVIYVGARAAEDLVLAERFAELREAGARVVAAVDAGAPGWRMEHPEWGEIRVGTALDHLAEDHPDLSQSDLYLGGPTPMIDAALRRLVREGTASADRVFLDRFN